MKFALLSLALAAVLGSASAQLDGLSACAINCLLTGIPSSGCSLTDTTCLCASTAFHDAVATCLETNCTADDITAVLAFEATECGTSS
ncbi:hypothetical protein GSI_08343 [Ganoderma sinense ZZ0214-1]|uniref:CFEM domain-containing protein n=1 Tax=Ganoderma sinense ZZ0214-1 TaxID=1077348 RepID=A0A2G8S710_9APHY|nr:hypothetical protein GSI_08343 [Ganoderma sinense ZZ0214-1]